MKLAEVKDFVAARRSRLVDAIVTDSTAFIARQQAVPTGFALLPGEMYEVSSLGACLTFDPGLADLATLEGKPYELFSPDE